MHLPTLILTQYLILPTTADQFRLFCAFLNVPFFLKTSELFKNSRCWLFSGPFCGLSSEFHIYFLLHRNVFEYLAATILFWGNPLSLPILTTIQLLEFAVLVYSVTFDKRMTDLQFYWKYNAGDSQHLTGH